LMKSLNVRIKKKRILGRSEATENVL
jgi:hypothetical protein